MSRNSRYLLSAGLLLSGCATFDNSTDPSRLDVATRASDSALVVISTGAPSACASSATSLAIVQIGGKNRKNETILSIDWSGVKSDFADHQGSINAVSLPAGTYRMIPRSLNPMVSHRSVPEGTFSLVAGEAVYLGEYYMLASCSLSNRIVLRNQRERDLALAISKNPSLSAMDFVTRIPELAAP